MKFSKLLLMCLSLNCSMWCLAGEYGRWSSSKMGGGGYLLDIVFSQSDPNIVYCNSDVGGIFKSRDKGTTWKMIHGAVTPVLSNVRSINLDPRNSKCLLAAVGNQWMPRQGVYLTEDGGDSWKKVCDINFFGNAGAKTEGTVFARDPKNPDKIYVISIDGLFVSLDNGNSWKSMGCKGYFPSDLKIDKTNSKRMWLSAKASTKKIYETKEKLTLNGGLYKSEDAGQTWEKLLDDGPAKITQPDYALDKLYAIIGRRGVGVSIDLGKSWKPVNDGIIYDAEKKLASISSHGYRALTAGQDFLLLASTNGHFYKLEKGSETWQKIDYKIHDKGWFLADKPGTWRHFGRATSSIRVNPRDPDHWIFTDWYAIYSTTDAGKNWHLTIDGVEMTVVHTVVADPSQPGKVLLGMADNALMHSVDSGMTFQMLNKSSAGNTKSIAFSKVNPLRVYCTGPRKWSWAANALRVSVDGGGKWSRCKAEGLNMEEKTFINTVAVSPVDEHTVYVAKSGRIIPGKGGVYKSTDGGKTFSWDSQGMVSKGNYFKESIWVSGSEIAVDMNGRAMVAISQGNPTIFYRLNNGDWLKSRSKVAGKHYSVVADPFVEKRFYLASKGSGAYRSDDGGITWKKLYDGCCRDIACDPVVQGRIAVSMGKEGKMFLSNDFGDSFTELDNNLPSRRGVKFCFSGDSLVAGTDGNGVFYMPLKSMGTSKAEAKNEDESFSLTDLMELITE